MLMAMRAHEAIEAHRVARTAALPRATSAVVVIALAAEVETVHEYICMFR